MFLKTSDLHSNVFLNSCTLTWSKEKKENRKAEKYKVNNAGCCDCGVINAISNART